MCWRLADAPETTEQAASRCAKQLPHHNRQDSPDIITAPNAIAGISLQSTSLTILVVLSNWSYPGQEGLHLQNAAVLQGLCKAGLRMHVLALVRDPKLVDLAQASAEWGPNASFTIKPIRLNYPLLLLQSLLLPRWLNPCWRTFKSVCATLQPDVVHLEGIGLTPWLGGMRDQRVLMSAVDAWSLRQSRLAQRARPLKRLFCLAYGALSLFAEQHFYRLASAVHVVSEEDAAYLKSVCPDANVKVIPVGLMSLASEADDSEAEGTVEYAPQSHHLVFWGDLRVGYLRDGLIWLLQEVLPRLPESMRSSISLEVLGRCKPDATLQEAAAPFRVEFRQWVDDLDVTLREAAVVLLPDASGSGMKNRTLQAMASGSPTLGTRFAFEGLMEGNNVEYMVRDDAYSFALALQELLTDKGKAQRMGQAGRQLVLRRYSLPAVVDAWHGLYLSCIDGRAKGVSG